MSTVKFWNWVKSFATRQIQKEYISRVHHDRLCTKCNTWTSEVGGCVKIEYSSCRWYELMTCKKCGQITKWDCRGMMPVLAEDQSND